MDNSKNLFALSLSSFVVNLSYGLIMPFIPLYLKAIGSIITLPIIGNIGIAAQIGFLAAGFMISRAFLAPKYGALSDYSGRKPIILVGLIFYSFLSAFYGFATNFWLLFIARFLQGVASAAVWPVAEALVADSSTEEKIGRNLGLFMLSMQFGWAFGPFIGSAGYYYVHAVLGFSSVFSYRALFLATAILSLISAIICELLVTDPKNTAPLKLKEIFVTIWVMLVALFKSTQTLARRNKTPLLKKPKIFLAMYAYGLLNGFAFSSIFPLMTIFLLDYYHLSIETIGVVVGLGSVVGMLMNPFGGWISDKRGRIPILWFSTIVGGIFLILIGVKLTFALLVAVFVLRQMAMAIRMPVFRAFQTEIVPSEVRGEEFGSVQMYFNIGSIIGPIFGGYMYDLLYGVEWEFHNYTFYGLIFLFSLTVFLSIVSLAGLTIANRKIMHKKSGNGLKKIYVATTMDLLDEELLLPAKK